MMKKKIMTLLIAMGAFYAASAQIDPHAIGLRIGGGAGFGAEASYQHGLSEKNRLEFDLGIGGNSHYNRFGLAGLYHWVWSIDASSFNWFVGPGVGLSFNNGKNDYDNFFGLAIGGQIGIEYNFKIPLQLSIDTRPMWDFLADTDGFGWGICLGVRYRF